MENLEIGELGAPIPYELEPMETTPLQSVVNMPTYMSNRVTGLEIRVMEKMPGAVMVTFSTGNQRIEQIVVRNIPGRLVNGETVVSWKRFPAASDGWYSTKLHEVIGWMRAAQQGKNYMIGF